MNDTKKTKIISKVVKFGSQSLTLFSLDGVTWSTRRDELQVIQERHEMEKLGLKMKDTAVRQGTMRRGPKVAAKAEPTGDAVEDPVVAEVEEEEILEDEIDPIAVADDEEEVTPEVNPVVSKRLKELDKILGEEIPDDLDKSKAPSLAVKGKGKVPVKGKGVPEKAGKPIHARSTKLGAVLPQAPKKKPDAAKKISSKAKSKTVNVKPKRRETAKPINKKIKAKARQRA